MVASRVTIPQEFMDITSKDMLLPPVAAFTYARMLFASFAQAELKLDSGATLGMTPERSVPDHGAGVPPLNDMQLMLGDTVGAEAIRVVLDLWGGDEGTVGHTVRIPRMQFSGGGYTEAHRTIAQNTAISTTPVDITSEQVQLTVKLTAGPYDSTNTRVAPFAAFTFDALRSVHSFRQYIATHLTYDRWKYIDTVLATLFGTGVTTLFPNDPGNALANEAAAFTVAAGNTRQFNVELVYRMNEYADTNNVPVFPDGNRRLIIHTRQERQLRSDPEFRGLTSGGGSSDPMSPLKGSFVAQIGNVKVYKSSTNLTPAGTTATTLYNATLFGPNAVGYAPAMASHLRQAAEDNYGLTPKVIWAAGEAFSQLDNRFIVIGQSD